MGTLYVILAILAFVCLVVVASVQPAKPLYTLAELKRRAAHSKAYADDVERLTVYSELTTLLRAVRVLLLVLLAGCLVGAFGWGGVVIALLAGVLYPAAARIGGIHRGGQNLYKRNEAWIVAFVHKYKRVLHALREPGGVAHDAPLKVHSREELAELIEHSKEVIGEHERRLLRSALAFSEQQVATIMTPRDAIQTVKHTEFLGPLVLDELHGLGHSYLPVITDDLDAVVGVLHLEGLLSLDSKQSTTAEKAMSRHIEYVHADTSLERALALFLRTKQHLLIVRDEAGKTIGLITLVDVITALTGHAPMRHEDDEATSGVNDPHLLK